MSLGAGWAWPLKPVLVTILFCIHGTHWSNVVCWLANMVVAIPVVFMPLAVFLSRPEEHNGCTVYNVFENDAENTEAIEEKHYMDQSTETEIECDAEDVCWYHAGSPHSLSPPPAYHTEGASLSLPQGDKMPGGGCHRVLALSSSVRHQGRNPCYCYGV
ncbi:uncharacterized protein LOC135104036 [Scylla paramamosain]|uniref:uncharacterized protein LOC135104036 n=1 Tax=Scylla paramamosain TaxID=85552 RepID=UPI0030837B95